MLKPSLLALSLAVTAAACSDDDAVIIADPGASLSVVNDSDFVIVEIYLTEVDNPDWGPNLLRGDVLFPGEELVLGVPCDFYDALLVDEDGIDCEIHDLDLCANDATWVIRNNTCTVFEAEAKRRAAEAAKQAPAISL